jgi:hypothetical protein
MLKSVRASASLAANREPRRASSTGIRIACCSAPTRFRSASRRRNRFSAEDLYHIYYRFLETDDEYFDYAPARLLPQGTLEDYGVALSDQILRKVYNQNAERVLGMKLVGA